MNIIGAGYSDTILYAGSKNNIKISNDNSNKTRMNRRNSWSGEYENINRYVSHQSIGKRPSTSSTTISRKTQSKICVSQSKPKSSSLHSFSGRYQELCDRYRLIPLPGVRAHLPRRALDFLVDRLKAEDWKPLLEALSSDRELHVIAIRSRYPTRKVVESADTQNKAVQAMRCPVLFTRYYLTGLIASLAECLTNSNSLACLELEGILLSPKYLRILIQGLTNSKNLQHLSLERCFIGDEGIELICRAIRHLPKVVTLNVTACGLTPIGVGYIASLLKNQKINRFVETWQQSLRYQSPNLDSMWGLRRITLNCNPSIGDEGVELLCSVLEDDLWVKAIDLQKSGVGENGANQLMTLLQFNVTLAIVDVRENKNIPADLVKQIMRLLSMNNKQRKSEYHWIGLAPSHSESKQKGFLERNWEIHRKLSNQRMSSSHPALQAKKITIYNRAHSQPVNG